MDAIKSVFTQYAGFSGRARRSEYWYFVLFNAVVSGVLSGIAQSQGGIFTALSTVYSLGVLIPSIAVCIRRLHDIGKSGWYLLFILIPLVGAIILIVWYCKDSMPGENQYGPNPKEVQTPMM